MDSPRLSSFNSEEGQEESKTYLGHPMMPQQVKTKAVPKQAPLEWKDESRLEEYS